MSSIASILASLVALFELVVNAVKKAKVAREEKAIEENGGGEWICDHFSNPSASDADSVHNDENSSNN